MPTQTKITLAIVFPVAFVFLAVGLALAADKGSSFNALVTQLQQAMNASDEQAVDRATRAMDQLLNQSTQPLQTTKEEIDVLVKMYWKNAAARGAHGSSSHRRQMEAFSLIHRVSPTVAQSLVAEAERNGNTSTATELRLIVRGRPSSATVTLAMDKAETENVACSLLKHENESVRRVGVAILRQSIAQVDVQTQNQLLLLIEQRIVDLGNARLQNELLAGVSSVLDNPKALIVLQNLASDQRLSQPVRDRVQSLLFGGPRHSMPLAPSSETQHP